MLKEIVKEVILDTILDIGSGKNTKQCEVKSLIDDWIGKYVLIRTYSSGVHFGYLDAYCPTTKDVILREARRLWSWEGAFTLSKVVTDGFDYEASRLSVKVPFFKCTEIEVVPVSEHVQNKVEALVAHGE